MSRAAKPSVFRFAPILLGFVALFVFGAGAYLQFQANERAAARVEAYVSGPPAGVPLDRFDPAAHTKDYGEALIVAQLDLDAGLHLAPVEDGGAPAFAVPMYGIRDNGEGMPRGIALFTGETFVQGRITAAGLMSMAERNGEIGPQMMLNGIADGPGAWSARLAEAGLRGQSSLVLYPFVEGRRAALVAEGAAPIFGQFAWAGGLCGLLALALLAFGATTRPASTRAAGASGKTNASPAEAEDARLDDALRGSGSQGRSGRSPVPLLIVAALLGAAGWLFRDRVDVAMLQEAARTRDFGLLREVIRPASDGAGQGAGLSDVSAWVAQVPELGNLITQLPSFPVLLAEARIWAEAQILAAQAGDYQAIAYLGLAGLGVLAVVWLFVRLARRFIPSRASAAAT